VWKHLQGAHTECDRFKGKSLHCVVYFLGLQWKRSLITLRQYLVVETAQFLFGTCGQANRRLRLQGIHAMCMGF
jgi:hypothetical protein